MASQTQPVNKESKPQKRLHILLVKQIASLATSAFGLVAALAWNSVIQEFVTTQIKPFLPQGSGLISLLIYALIVTVMAVVITYQLSAVLDRLEN
jgi:hypothetical protein